MGGCAGVKAAERVFHSLNPPRHGEVAAPFDAAFGGAQDELL